MKKLQHTRVYQTPDCNVDDATDVLKFWVNHQHILRAVPGDKRRCVLALALRDKIPNALKVEVGTSITKVVYKHQIVRYSTGNALASIVRIFDTKHKWFLPPGVYKLFPPPLYLRLYKNGNPKGKKKRGPHTSKTDKRRIPGTRLMTRCVTRYICD